MKSATIALIVFSLFSIALSSVSAKEERVNILPVQDAAGRGETVKQGTTTQMRVIQEEAPDAPLRVRQETQDQVQLKRENLMINREEVRSRIQQEMAEKRNNATGAANALGKAITTRDHLNNVAERVATLQQLRIADGDQGIGDDVRMIASEQLEDQREINRNLSKIEKRQAVVRRLWGTDYRATQALQNLVERNETRIARLEELQTQTTDPEEQRIIEEAIVSLQEENGVLSEQVAEQESTFSLLGWLNKLINK
jgi:hypothetical protein